MEKNTYTENCHLTGLQHKNKHKNKTLRQCQDLDEHVKNSVSYAEGAIPNSEARICHLNTIH